jgi:hypothetical protein
VAGAEADGSAGLASVAADAAGAAAGVWASKAEPAVSKLNPKAREASNFFIVMFSFFFD